MSDRRIHVAHIVPSLDIGGVEIGILKSYPALYQRLDYRVFFVRKRGILNIGQSPIYRLFWQILMGRWEPDIIITSLWWAHPIGWLLSGRNKTWIAFFHNAAYAHRVDRVIQQWAWRNADKRIADSGATAQTLQASVATQCEIIPYFFPHAACGKKWEERTIDITWVGRNAPVKRLDLFIKFLRNLKPLMPRCRIVVAMAGAAHSDLLKLSTQTDWQVEIIQNADNKTVLGILNDARFYVLLSDREGMSMSTVEAIQSGCLPVVRPVGEIANYVNSEGGVIVDEITAEGLQTAAKKVATINQEKQLADKMRTHAQQALNGLPGYTESLIKICIASEVESRR